MLSKAFLVYYMLMKEIKITMHQRNFSNKLFDKNLLGCSCIIFLINLII